MSEIERGQKEASSELLAAICTALDVPLSELLSEVSDAVALEEAAMAVRLQPLEVGAVPLSTNGDVVASAA
jgi:transcriptional regulator with XRE-family HTH domain